MTKLEKWIQRGKNGKYVIKRLKNSETLLTSENLKKMKEIGNTFLGKNYDISYDMWNIGLLIYEMATNTKPFSGPSAHSSIK